MAWQLYNYLSRWHRTSKKSIYRPLLDVDVTSGKISERFTALVDSGTEVTIMNTQIAHLLNISPVGKPAAHIFGLGDLANTKKVGFFAKVNIVVPEFPSEVLTSTVIFLDDAGGSPFDILLGQDDFFRRFLVKFQKSKNKFYLDVAW